MPTRYAALRALTPDPYERSPPTRGLDPSDPRHPQTAHSISTLDLGVKAHIQAPHPPIGVRGLVPQNTCVPSIPIIVTSTRFSTIDLAVALPTPTGPPEAV